MLPPVKPPLKAGFTLIELSIVLVIIGLIIGGVLVGQDLISAASVRAQISQIEKYRAATNTFRGKYGSLPGDIPQPIASQYGFTARGQWAGEGDGNGLLEGISSDSAGQNWGTIVSGGETAMFWVDLSKAGLIDGSFTTASPISNPAGLTLANISQYFPAAKLRNNYLYIWSGGWGILSTPDRTNYFGLSAMTSTYEGTPCSVTDLTVAEAYAIDTKMDDGLPQSGGVMAVYPGYYNEITWAAGGSVSTYGQTGAGASTGNPTYAPVSTATGYATTNCFDNNGVAGVQQYSMKNAALANCALSFKFQ